MTHNSNSLLTRSRSTQPDQEPALESSKASVGPKIMRFEDLLHAEQERARGWFLGAGAGDGYVYELDCDQRVLCRRHIVAWLGSGRDRYQ